MFTIIKNWLYRSLSLLLEKIGLRRLRHCPVGTLSTITHEECGVSTKREKMKINLNDVTNIDSLTTINANFDKIVEEFQDKVLYRDSPTGEPNTVENNIDMNGFDIINVKGVYSTSGRWATINEVTALNSQTLTYKNQAQQYSLDSLQYKNDISDIATQVQGYQLNAEFTYDQLNNRFLGVRNSDPSTDNKGDTLQSGAMYLRTTAPELMRIYNGSTWQDVGSIAATTTNTIDPALFATKLEAEQGVNDAKVVTPAKVKDAINSQVKAGFTSTGPLVLPGDAAANLQATPLQQVNALITAAVDEAVATITLSEQSGRLLRVLRYTASGTFEKQAGENTVEVTVIGPGGSSTSFEGSNGGGAGGTAIKRIATSSLNASEPVTVGARGTLTPSSFKGVIGGYGLEGSQSNPGLGGEASGGDLNIRGGSGGGCVPNNFLRTSGWCVYGSGGNSTLGGGAPGFFASASDTTTYYDGAPNTGGGGSGVWGAGAAGYVEIRTYS